jgi:hypothetical protein
MYIWKKLFDIWQAFGVVTRNRSKSRQILHDDNIIMLVQHLPNPSPVCALVYVPFSPCH